MNAFVFHKATKEQARLRLCLTGAAGSGKTYTALTLAQVFGRVALIDTEHGSASKYAGLFEFDTLTLTDFHPQNYIAAIRAAEAAGYDAIIIDSLSHAWNGKGGALELVDAAAKRERSGNTFTAWREVTPIQNSLIEAILTSSAHVIATLRSKTAYVLETNDRGKQVPRNVGLAPIQREGLEYEFDIVMDLSQANEAVVSKTRCPQLTGGVFPQPGPEVAQVIKDWLTDGIEPHWATGPGRERVRALLIELGLRWADIDSLIEPGRVLTGLKDTALTEEAFTARLTEIAAG